jgi:hypothetical protein
LTSNCGSKLALLEAELPPQELEDSEELDDLRERADRLKSEMDDTLEEFDDLNRAFQDVGRYPG